MKRPTGAELRSSPKANRNVAKGEIPHCVSRKPSRMAPALGRLVGTRKNIYAGMPA